MRRRPVRRALAVLAIVLVAAGCAGSDVGGDAEGAERTSPGTQDLPAATSEPAVGDPRGRSGDADGDASGGGTDDAGVGDPAVGDAAADDGATQPDGDVAGHEGPSLARGAALPGEGADDDAPRPVWVSLPEIGVEAAPIIAVGVEADGQMEIPGATEVGWYRFGASPGEGGSSVLAAHIAFDGVDGVFRDLGDMSEGDLVTVGFDDGSADVFVVTDAGRYLKEDLPRDDIFARDGDPRLVLITCGGGFNEQLRSYDSNVVLYAEPVG